MDSDQGKLFIGGISWETSQEKLSEYFGQYGDVVQSVVMRDKVTGRPRGFGFVVFSDPSVLDTVLQEKHTIDGRTVEAKRALSREEQQTSARSGNVSQGRNSGNGGNIRTKKIFVGGLPPTLTEDGFRQYFEAYGHVTDVVIMYDQNTQRPRGFGFISFDTEDAVDRVLHKSFHDLNGKQVEVKRALPKDANPGGVSRTMSGGSGGSGGYQGYGSSGGSANSYDGRMDSNSGPPGAPRSSWGTQTPSGYGTMGYGNAAAWGAAGAAGGAASGGPGSAATGQSPTGAAGYGSQGYGYGGYGGNDGSYGNAGYGAVGGRSGGAPSSNASSGGGDGGGYMGSGYGEANGNSGYGNASWRSDSSQGSGNYGGTQANGPYGGGRRYAREFKGGVKCPLMAEPELLRGW
ncbi:hypothetical protein CCACVL1_04457 [Corchorus capsularis]|uniref:RRM domain-containing protein n=1 Tax=Corchorus capsularis TaxID=210143 RepID=A0A1R3JSP3_COCAP|nr:hypothetical protein CCACVL1_04457 [Corchorus capsularis]